MNDEMGTSVSPPNRPEAGLEGRTVDGFVGDTAPAVTAMGAALESTPPAPDAAVSLRRITKQYGRLKAVNDLSLDVPVGAVFGLIGPNGAGKSTTFSILCGLLRPTSGAAMVLGVDPVGESRKVKKRVGYMPDVLGHYDTLTVDEYLRFFAGTYGVPRGRVSDLVGDLLELVDLDVKRNSMVNDLSRGMKQRLSLARALVHDPEVLILDEPASGLDPRARIELRDLILRLKDMGKTLVVSSHILSELEQICTHIAVIEAGRLLAAGSTTDIRERLDGTRKVKVRFLDGTEERIAVSTDGELAALIRRLIVEDGRDVVEFVEERGDLEQLFLSITEGIVQ